jgi:hypothetical protein
MALYSYGLHGYGLYSYGLYSYGYVDGPRLAGQSSARGWGWRVWLGSIPAVSVFVAERSLSL